MNAPPFLSLIKFSLVIVVAVLSSLQNKTISEIVNRSSSFFSLDQNAFIMLFLVTIILIIFTVHPTLNVIQEFWNEKVISGRKVAKNNFEEMERKCLITIFNSMDGKLWRDKTKWCTDQPLEQWKGVIVDPVSGRVKKLILPGNNLGGRFPFFLL